MAESYHRLTARFIAELSAAGAPPELAVRIESYLIVALDKADRDRRAAELLAKFGPDIAAANEGCCRSTIYNRAHRARKSPSLGIGK